MMSAKRLALKTGGERRAGVKLFVLRQVTSNQHGDEVGATPSDVVFNQGSAGAPAAGEASEMT